MDNFQQKVSDVRTARPDGPDTGADGRHQAIFAGSSRWRRRMRGPRGGWPLVILVALVVGVVSQLSGPLNAALRSSSGHSTKPSTVARSTSATNQTQATTTVPHRPVTCVSQPGAGAPTNVALPDVVGQNAKTASEQLQQLGLGNVELSSANPEYQLVIVASNWTVVSTDPAPCTVMNPYDHVVLMVTKPSGGFGDFLEDRLSQFRQPH